MKEKNKYIQFPEQDKEKHKDPHSFFKYLVLMKRILTGKCTSCGGEIVDWSDKKGHCAECGKEN